MLKFFMKHILIWVPVIGLAWWALDMPFLKRFTKEEIEKNFHMHKQGRISGARVLSRSSFWSLFWEEILLKDPLMCTHADV